MDDTKEKQRQAAIKGRSEGMWLTTTSLVILAGVALAFALAYTRAVMIPFVLALFIVTIVSPILDFQVLRLRIPRIIAVTVTLIVVVAFIGLSGLLVTEVVGTVASTAGGYSQVVEALLSNGFDRFVELFAFIFEDKRDGQAAEANAVAEVNEPAVKQVVAKVVPKKQEAVKKETTGGETVKKEIVEEAAPQYPYFKDGILIFKPAELPPTSVKAPTEPNEMPEAPFIEFLSSDKDTMRREREIAAVKPVDSGSDRIEREIVSAKPGDSTKIGDDLPDTDIVQFQLDGSVVGVPSKDPNETLAFAADMISQTTSDSNEPDSKLLSKAEDIKQYINEFRAYIFKFGQGAIGATMDIISSSVFVVIFVIFLLSGRDPRVVRKAIFEDIDHKIRRYICTKMAISAVTGILVWISLKTFGLTLAPLFGVLAFLLNFIPSIGSVISTILPVPVAMAQIQVLSNIKAKSAEFLDEAQVQAQALMTDPNRPADVNDSIQLLLSNAEVNAEALFTTLFTNEKLISEMVTQNGALFLVLVIAVPGVIQFVMGSLIDPKLMGEGLNLHPVTILLALSFWGLLWGIVGMFLAAPITAAIRIILMQFETLKPFGLLLAGKLPEENGSSG